MSKYTINHNQRTIEYQVIRKNVKNINLRVKPSLEVLVSANKYVSDRTINSFVESKASWINKHLEKFRKAKFNEKESTLKNGAFISYLGKHYELNLIESSRNEMELYKEKIYMYVTNPSDDVLKKKVYYHWLRERAKVVFKDILDAMYELIAVYKVNYPKMTIRKMKTRWGSCNPRKCKININLYLMKEDRASIEYVILHELVHLIHANHSKDFYSFLGGLMSDHNERKQLMKQKVIRPL